MKNLILFLFIALSLNLNALEIKDNDGKFAQKLVKENGALLLDVRTKPEHMISSISEAKRIHIGDLEERMDDVKKWTKGNKEKPIVVFCAAGVRAEKARAILKKAGYKNVINMGGISNWPKK